MTLQLFKKSTTPIFVPDIREWLDEDEGFGKIRCPLCDWEPTASSVWSCQSFGTPEPFFGGCGTIWNTFSTGGKCPGCSHQWAWTSCLRCEGWSLHKDWYKDRDSGDHQ